jgi:hypothetical protein
MAQPTRTRVRFRPKRKETWGKWTSGSDLQTRENLAQAQKQQNSQH